MSENQDPAPGIQDVTSVSVTEASLRLQLTDLLLRQQRDPLAGRLIPEQWEVLQQIEAALETYGSYFYPPEQR